MDARLVIAAAEPLRTARLVPQCAVQRPALAAVLAAEQPAGDGACPQHSRLAGSAGLQRPEQVQAWRILLVRIHPGIGWRGNLRSEEHTSELQSLMRISYAVFCLKKKNKINTIQTIT